MKKIGHSMKYLIVSGDSNTTDNFDSITNPDLDFSYKKWPELLAEKLGMEVINVARSGQGNEFIYTTIRNEIVKIEDKSQIGLVIAAWSQAMRGDYREVPNDYDPKVNLPTTKHYHWSPWRSQRINTHGNLPGWVQKSLGHYLDFQILCERYNLPYVHFQMIELYEHFIEGVKPSQNEVHYGADPDTRAIYPGDREKDEQNIIKMILEYEKKLNTDKFIGWPPVEKLGGFRFKDKLDLWSQKDSPRRVSNIDNHPNGLGHVAICDRLYLMLQEYNIVPEDATSQANKQKDMLRHNFL